MLVGVGLFVAAYGCGGKSDGDDDGGGGESGTTAGGAGKGAAGSAGKGSAGSGVGGSGAGAAGAAGAGGRGTGGTNPSGGVGGDAGGAPEAGGGGDAASGGSVVAGAGGNAGSSAGVAGTAGDSGSGGDAGAPSSGAECETADDCALLDDCCSCEAVPKGMEQNQCDAACVQSACDASGISAEDVTCLYGRCVFSRSCNGSVVTCPAKPIECPAGQVLSVEGDCWGPCVLATDCQDVASCASCPKGTVCVAIETQLPHFQCVEVPSGCKKGSYCDCITCPFAACLEDEEAVHCSCPFC